MQMVQYECPKHWKPSGSSTFGVERILFSHYWPSGVIRIGLPVWNWKSWKISRTKGVYIEGYKWSSLNAPGTKNPLSHGGWKNSLFPLLALWGNKNWPPSIMVQQIENCKNKMGLKGCKCSSLSAPGTQSLVPHSGREISSFSAESAQRKRK